ncbi:MAG TPA: DUF4836 family protein [Flavisolibacter sp.]|nr:DUF4836 family protein [Flavisolibacter sp.]
MKRIPLLLTVATLLCLASCKNANKSDLLVPKNATMVVHINGASVFSKLSWDDIKNSEFFKMAHDSAKDEYKRKLLENPEVSGVDIKNDFAYFMTQGRSGYGTFQGKIKDAAAFEKFNKEIKKDATVKKSGALTYIQYDANTVLAWDNKSFLLVSHDQQSFSRNAWEELDEDPDDTIQEPVKPSITPDSLLNYAVNLKKLSADELLTTDNRFSDLLKEKGELHIWINSEEAYASVPNNPMSMMKAGNIIKGTISASTVSFENGKIEMKGKQYMGNEMQELFESHKPTPVSADIINRIPSDNVVAAFAMNIPSEGLRAFFKVAGLDGIANMMLSKYQLNLEQLTNAYKGEMVFALSDVSVKEEEQSVEGTDFKYKTKNPDGKFFMALAVNNRPSFEKVWNVLQQEFFKEKRDSSKWVHKLNDQWFAFSNSSESVDRFLAGGNTKQFEFTSKISGHPFGAYIDLRKLIPVTKSFLTRTPGESTTDSTWENFIMTGGEFKNGAMLSQVEINLVDKNTNSLKQLFQFISGMFNKSVVTDGNRDVVEDLPIQSDTTAAPF